MIVALQTLSDGEPRHGAHAIPGTSGYRRNPTLRSLEKRGWITKSYVSDLRDGRPVVYWTITDEGQVAWRLLRAGMILT